MLIQKIVYLPHFEDCYIVINRHEVLQYEKNTIKKPKYLDIATNVTAKVLPHEFDYKSSDLNLTLGMLLLRLQENKIKKLKEYAVKI